MQQVKTFQVIADDSIPANFLGQIGLWGLSAKGALIRIIQNYMLHFLAPFDMFPEQIKQIRVLSHPFIGRLNAERVTSHTHRTDSDSRFHGNDRIGGLQTFDEAVKSDSRTVDRGG